EQPAEQRAVRLAGVRPEERGAALVVGEVADVAVAGDALLALVEGPAARLRPVPAARRRAAVVRAGVVGVPALLPGLLRRPRGSPRRGVFRLQSHSGSTHRIGGPGPRAAGGFSTGWGSVGDRGAAGVSDGAGGAGGCSVASMEAPSCCMHSSSRA